MDRRRRFMMISVALAAVAKLAPAQGAGTDAFPAKPITLIVPWPAGGATDICMRALAEATAPHLAQPIDVENRHGTSGVLGAMALMKAAPDGYTISQIPFSVFRTPYLVDRAPFDPRSDFTYIIGVSAYTFGVVVRSGARWQSWNELLDYARANPGKVAFGTPGSFTSPHITMHDLALKHGIKWVHVPFRGSAENMEALLGGEIDVSADASSWSPYIAAGKMRLLVTWGERRTRNWPKVPTLKELGDNIVTSTPYGIAGPKGMDPQVLRILHDAFKKGMEDPRHLAALEKYGQELWYMSSSDYTRWVQQTFAAQKAVMLRLKSQR
jgi:tripartite-type tricarboxylate transporter receptor subunit TctC